MGGAATALTLPAAHGAHHRVGHDRHHLVAPRPLATLAQREHPVDWPPIGHQISLPRADASPICDDLPSTTGSIPRRPRSRIRANPNFALVVWPHSTPRPARIRHRSLRNLRSCPQCAPTGPSRVFHPRSRGPAFRSTWPKTRKPSNGLEPLTPSLPWKPGASTRCDQNNRNGSTITLSTGRCTTRKRRRPAAAGKLGRNLDAASCAHRGNVSGFRSYTHSTRQACSGAHSSGVGRR